MSSRLQLDMRNLSLGRRHLVKAYEVKAGIGVIAGNTVWSMPERLECEVLQKARYINTLTFTYLYLCGACRSKWRLTDIDLCPCGETQTTSHIVESCPLTKLNGGLSRLHSADEDAVSWLTSYGSWHAYEKNNGMVYGWWFYPAIKGRQ